MVFLPERRFGAAHDQSVGHGGSNLRGFIPKSKLSVQQKISSTSGAKKKMLVKSNALPPGN